jgi:hypothetical protein
LQCLNSARFFSLFFEANFFVGVLNSLLVFPSIVLKSQLYVAMLTLLHVFPFSLFWKFLS